MVLFEVSQQKKNGTFIVIKVTDLKKKLLQKCAPGIECYWKRVLLQWYASICPLKDFEGSRWHVGINIFRT